MLSQELKLIWQEEFNASGKPDPAKWNYETGFIRNLEKQIYTSRKKNLRLNNGYLEIIARKEKRKNPRYDARIRNYRYNTPYANYTSGSINTRTKFEFLYGRVDVRAKLPRGNGVWPAIWMLGANFEEIEYPKAGEIDIMEYVGKTPDTIHGTLHYAGKNGISSSGGDFHLPSASEGFHLYSLNWTREKIEFLVDNQVYHSFSIDEAGADNPFRKPFYLLVNLALGGNWAGEIDDEALPQKFIIDYIRVYQEEE